MDKNLQFLILDTLKRFDAAIAQSRVNETFKRGVRQSLSDEAHLIELEKQTGCFEPEPNEDEIESAERLDSE